jgi:hypothetical protein
MLDEPCEGCDIGSKPEDVVWWTYPEDGKTKQVPGWEMLAKQVSSNKHKPKCWIPGKPQSIISLLLYEINWVYMLYVLLY